MSTLPEFLSQLQFIGFEATLLGVIITATIILVARDWRFLLFALLIQYILVGLTLSRLVRPDIAILTVLTGAFVCPILFLSARQVMLDPLSISALEPEQTGFWPRLFAVIRGPSVSQDVAPTRFTFRLFVALLIILVALTVSDSFPLPSLPPLVTTIVYWLALAGLITLTLTEDPLKSGLGLFTVFSAFGLLYFTLESSLLLTGLWGAVNLLIALAIGYLTVVKGTGPQEDI